MLPPEDIAAALLAQRLPLTAYLASVTRDFHLAEDVFQEVSVKAVGRAAEFESPAHVIHWARVAGRNRAIDILRSRDGRYVGLSETMLATLAAEWPEKADAEPLHDALAHCLKTITANNRELLRLRYFERRPCDEVAALTGRKIETVYQALTRLHKSLGDCMRARLSTEVSS
ncbi:MAG: sigma-70 family RNA polymerase sigma factor [Verrucomicrobiales bacterium]|nr:sigma-70 family RNA polymerase sigma factor [Verrucomicrobiales bacterium]HQW28606.1 sigma-70 family RNA polymerase sigma factor [Verrucomicrobiales bacterium]